MKLKAAVPVFAAILLFSGCSVTNGIYSTESMLVSVTTKEVTYTARNDFEEDSDEEEVYPAYDEFDIKFIRRISNYAWGYTDFGSFVTSDGCIFSYDFSEVPEDNEDMTKYNTTEEEYISRLLEIANTSSPCCYADDEALSSCMTWLEMVDTGAKYSNKNVSCDRGQDTLYGVISADSGEPKLLKIKSTGDNEIKIKDKYADKIIKNLTLPKD